MDKRVFQIILFWFLLDVIKPQYYDDYSPSDSVESRQKIDIVAAITTLCECILNCLTKTLPGGKCTAVFACLWKCITFEPPKNKPPAQLNSQYIGGRQASGSQSSKESGLGLDQIAVFFGCFQDCLLGNLPSTDLSLTSFIHCSLSKCLCKF